MPTLPVTEADRELWKWLLDAPNSMCVRIDSLPDDCPELQRIAQHRASGVVKAKGGEA